MRGERIEHFETVRLTKSGERIDVSLTISPVKDEAGRVIGGPNCARHHSAETVDGQTLRTTERLASVGRLAATVAHDKQSSRSGLKPCISREIPRCSDRRPGIPRCNRGGAGTYIPPHKADTWLLSPNESSECRESWDDVNPLISVFATRARSKGIEIRPEIRRDPEIYTVPGEMAERPAVARASCLKRRIRFGIARRAGGNIFIATSRPRR